MPEVSLASIEAYLRDSTILGLFIFVALHG